MAKELKNGIEAVVGVDGDFNMTRLFTDVWEGIETSLSGKRSAPLGSAGVSPSRWPG
jgi:hypothetical protein